MIYLLLYFAVTFFVNHAVVQAHQAYTYRRVIRCHGVLFRVLMVCAVLLRIPFYILGIVLYNACCTATIVAALADLVFEHPLTYWIFVLADNFGYAAYALRAFLVREFPFLFLHSRSTWSFTYYDFHRGNGRIFSLAAEPQNGYRMHARKPFGSL